jgi:hypothetical protein
VEKNILRGQSKPPVARLHDVTGLLRSRCGEPQVSASEAVPGNTKPPSVRRFRAPQQRASHRRPAFPLGSSLMQATLMMTARRETVANSQADSCL